jgi:hypothetical protein
MSESLERLREALIDAVPEDLSNVPAGKICVAALLRKGVTPPWAAEGDKGPYTCTYNSAHGSKLCAGRVALVGTAPDTSVEVTGSRAQSGGSLREEDITADLQVMREVSEGDPQPDTEERPLRTLADAWDSGVFDLDKITDPTMRTMALQMEKHVAAENLDRGK